MSYKDFFKGKKVAVVGCGEHGAMLDDIKFLAKLKANVSVFELRSPERLGKIAHELELMLLPGGPAGRIVSCTFSAASNPIMPESVSIGALSETTGLSFTEKLATSELIILAPDIPKNSLFLKPAIKAGVRIEYPDTLLLKLAPPLTVIGVMGTMAKTSVATMIFDMLGRYIIENNQSKQTKQTNEKKEEDIKTSGLFLVDAETGGALANLKKVKKNDLMIVRIPEQMMNEYHEARITPHVAVITHASGKSSFDLLEFQTYNSYIVASDHAVDMLKKHGGFQVKAKIIRTRQSGVPEDWNISFTTPFVRENAALAREVAELFRVDQKTIRASLSEYKDLKGRMEIVKKVGTKTTPNIFYNDTASIRPESTIAAVRALSHDGKPLALICGGAYTGSSYEEFFKILSQYVSDLIVLPGSGTFSERSYIDSLGEKMKIHYVANIIEAVTKAKEMSSKGGRVLFSPAFDAYGLYESRHARGDVFVKAVKG